MDKRFAIIGLPGSGKSTFSIKLGKHLNIPVHHLDQFMFIDTKRTPQGEFLEVKKALVNEDSWIIEGCSISTLEMRFQKADVIIYFEIPRLVCIWRLFKRSFQKEKIGGCLNRINWEIIKYAWNFKQEKGPLIKTLERKYPHVKIIVFKSNGDAERYLAELSS